MRILQVITSLNPNRGGPSHSSPHLAASFCQLGDEVEVVCLDDPDSGFLSGETFRIHALGQSRGPWGYHSKLRPWLRNNLPRFDAAILHGLWQYQNYALLKATQQPNTPPYFVFPHGMLDPWFQRNPQRRIKALRNWFYWKCIEERVIRYARAMLFTSAMEMRLGRTTFSPYQPKREFCVGLGIRHPPAHNNGMHSAFVEKLPALNGNPYFLFLGRIHPKKGVDLLIQAYADFCHSLRASSNPPIARLVIAGPGLESPYGRQMVKLAARTCPAKSICWPGMITGDAKWGALYNCEALVLPTHHENFGIAVVEALACGKPVLVSNQVNIWREIDEDAAGLIGDDTAAGMEALFSRWHKLSQQEKTLMCRAARSCYERRFSVAACAQRIRDIIEDLVSR